LLLKGCAVARGEKLQITWLDTSATARCGKHAFTNADKVPHENAIQNTTTANPRKTYKTLKTHKTKTPRVCNTRGGKEGV
jgi:hypothetical protein